MITIRNEEERDYKVVEEITRKAFYNLYIPGCAEHYLVHIMRGHEDFIPELDFVIELDGQVIGNIMYTKARLVDEAGTEKEILTFGPVSIAPTTYIISSPLFFINNKAESTIHTAIIAAGYFPFSIQIFNFLLLLKPHPT